MNTTIKLGIAGALALGAAAANAQIAAPSTGSSTVVLFAEVLNSSNAEVASYAGNTGVSVASAYSGTTATYTGSTALASLFAADAPGDTLVWGIEGSSYTGTPGVQQNPGNTKIVTTAVNPFQIGTTTYAAENSINAGLSNIISSVNLNIATPGPTQMALKSKRPPPLTAAYGMRATRETTLRSAVSAHPFSMQASRRRSTSTV